MRHKFQRKVMIHLGGSVMYPEEIDAVFLKNFNRFIRTWVKRGKQFVIVTGGGRLARQYQEVAHQIGRITDEDKDWLGIHATRTNAHLLRTIFRDIADPVILDNREKAKRLQHPVTIGAGWRPGWSTDYVCAALAEDFHIHEIIIAGRPAYVYTKDNRRYKDAKPIPEMTWKEYFTLVPKKWIPGFHVPVDVVAARLCATRGIRAIVVNGKDLKNFHNLLAEKNFKGSIIR